MDDTIEAMNEAAGKGASRQSPRKRKVQEDVLDVGQPAKRRSSGRIAQAAPNMATITTETDAPTSRLRSRKSNAARQLVDRNDPFALPQPDDDVSPAAAALKTPARGNTKTMRSLLRKTANGSPLKGRGEIPMPSVGVDLLDSPEKRTRKRVREVERLPLTMNGQTANDRNTASEEPDRDAVIANRRATIPSQTAQKTRSSANLQQPAPDGPEPIQESRKIVDKQAQASGSRSDADDVEFSDGSEHVAEDAASREEAREEDGQQEGEEAEEQTTGTSKHCQKAVNGVPVSRGQDRDQEARDEADEATAVEEATKHNLMRGVEDVAEFYGSRSSWETVLFSAHKIKEDRSRHEAESELGKQILKRIKFLRQEYKRLRSVANKGEEDVSLLRQAQLLQAAIQSFEEGHKNRKSLEFVRMGRDIHQQIVPLLVLLLKAAFKARTESGCVIDNSLEEILTLLRTSCQASIVASQWEPRPSGLGDGVKLHLRHIRKEVREISEPFENQMSWKESRIDDKRIIDAQEEKQKREHAWFMNSFTNRRDRIFAEQREERQRWAQEQQAQNRPRQELAVRAKAADMRGSEDALDIDDIDDMAASPQRAAPQTVRPSAYRQQTEEIPGPTSAEWSGKQTNALFKWLIFHQGAGRFQRIFDESGDELGERSYDDILEQAQFIRASFKARLESTLDHTWDWLRSVPT